ncbi:MAG: ferritin family protein [Desulfuromonadales bacterium]
MSDESEVCLTFEAACMAGIEMENNIFQNYLQALRVVKNQAAREILQEAAAAKLAYKHKLEQAVLEGGLGDLVAQGPVSVMNLSVRCCDQNRIDADADARKALAYAIQMAQDALKFYRDMANRCSGAPMAKIFTLLGDDQTRHLQQLEDTFEEHFLPEG